MILCVGLLAFASCKKDWTCKCTESVGGNSYSVTIEDMTRADAKTECDKGDSAIGTTVIDCKLIE